MNTQDMNRLRSEYRARIQTAAYRHPEWASREDALNYQQAAQICGLLADLTTGAEARSWAKKKAACQEKLRKSWTMLCPSSWKHEPDFDLDFSPLPEFSAQDGDSPNESDIDFMRVADDACDAQAEETDEPAAADLNDKDACCRLGLRYYKGQGVEQDYTRAVELFRKAAEQGNGYAMRLLGDCYRSGCGVEKDCAQAVEWYRKAAELGDRHACYWFAIYCDCTDPDHTQAAQWYRKAAELYNENAYYWSGLCSYFGRDAEQDYAQAAEWFRKAAELGDWYAYYWLGTCYDSGRGVEQDYAQAVEWYRKAAEEGDEYACYRLGTCYLQGRGVKKDLTQAVKCFREAAEQWHKDAQLALADCYEKGRGVPKNPTLAARWRTKNKINT